MRICKAHWRMCRDAVDSRGMGGLVAKSGEAAMDNMIAEIEGTAKEQDFDPLMSLNWFFSGEAMKNGGLYLMAVDPEHPDLKDNDGHYCPICEFEKHMQGFDAAEQIGMVADQMAEHCRKEGLIPPVS